jgi:hypothetical protein
MLLYFFHIMLPFHGNFLATCGPEIIGIPLFKHFAYICNCIWNAKSIATSVSMHKPSIRLQLIFKTIRDHVIKAFFQVLYPFYRILIKLFSCSVRSVLI